MTRLSPYQLMYTFFGGMGASLAFGVGGALVVFFVDGLPEAQRFFGAFTTEFKTLVSFGMILGTALVVYRSQSVIPDTIESAFTAAELADTRYADYKQRFWSRRRTMLFAAELVVVAFVVFTYCRFPLSSIGTDLMIGAACIQYALGSYVGRKLGYAGMMLHSLLGATVSRNLFKERELDDINTYVHLASTLTVVFVYIHVLGYYSGPFKYDSFFGDSVRPLLLIPAVIATPVLLIFNFYPRAVLRRIYSQSIDVEIKKLRVVLKSEALSAFEKRSHLIEFDKMCREELRHSLQLSLSDLPIAITVSVMLLQSFLKD